MAFLLDSGILLRLVNTDDVLHEAVRRSVKLLATNREQLLTTTQNVAEFYNVATRPIIDNGLGRSVSEALSAIRTTIRPLAQVLREHSRHYLELEQLLETYQVLGKRVHDARLVASMLTWRITHILTLNDKDFRRYAAEDIQIAMPQSIIDSRG
jgi:predicted nucleic acid-binding protein